MFFVGFLFLSITKLYMFDSASREFVTGAEWSVQHG